jgi:hypothetical protein
MTAANWITRFGFFGFSLITCLMGAILLVIVTDRLNKLDALTNAPAVSEASTPTAVPDTRAAQWAVPNPDNPSQTLIEAFAFSSNWDHQGAPSLRFYDTDINRPGPDRSFEIGFYRYGSSWYSQHYITEFWLGDGAGGTLSIAGNNQGGGDLQVRNPTDTGSIQLDYRNADRPMIWLDNDKPLYLKAAQGLVSENHQTFMDGISILGEPYSGQVSSASWANGKITIPTTAVQDESFISIMPLSEATGRWWICEISTGKDFTLCSTSGDETMRFRWLLIGTG